MSRNFFSFQSILNEVGRAFTNKAEQPPSTANEEEDTAGVDVSQAVGGAKQPSKSTECLSVTRVPPVRNVTHSAHSVKTSKSSASPSKSTIQSNRVLRSHATTKLRPRKRQVIRGRTRVTRSSSKSKKSPPSAKKRSTKATKAITSFKSQDKTIKCTTSDNSNVCISIEYVPNI